MQHKNDLVEQNNEASKSSLAFIRANVLYRWQVSLFSPSFKHRQPLVTHTPVKANSFRFRANKEVRIILPICMDRTSGDQLFSPKNMALLFCLIGDKFKGVKIDDKFKGVKLNITILLTGELCGWNILRKGSEQNIEAARAAGAQQAKQYEDDITPIIKEFMQSGHSIEVKHWSEVYNQPMVLALHDHLQQRYKIDPDYRTYIDFALAKFFRRQHKQGEFVTAKHAKKCNIEYLFEELAVIINIFAFQHGRYDFQLYEYDELSPKLAEATLRTCKDFLAQHHLSFDNFGSFMMEYKKHALDPTTADNRRNMLAGFAEMDNAFSKGDQNEIARYKESCFKMQVVVSNASRSECEKDFVNTIAGKKLDYNFSNFDRIEETYHHNYQLIPHVGFKTIVVGGGSLNYGDSLTLKDALDTSLITLHYFSTSHFNFSQNDLNEFDSRLKRHTNFQNNCMVAIFDSSEVCLQWFYNFEQLRKSQTSVSNTLYLGISNPELQKLLAAISKETTPPSEQVKVTIKLLSPDEKLKQIRKFLYGVYSNIPKEVKIQSTKDFESRFSCDDYTAIKNAINALDLATIKTYTIIPTTEYITPIVYAINVESGLPIDGHYYPRPEIISEEHQQTLVNIIHHLVTIGAEHKKLVPCRNEEGFYPLELAVARNSKCALRTLVTYYDNQNTHDQMILNRALDRANEETDIEIIEILRQAGATSNIVNKQERSSYGP